MKVLVYAGIVSPHMIPLCDNLSRILGAGNILYCATLSEGDRAVSGKEQIDNIPLRAMAETAVRCNKVRQAIVHQQGKMFCIVTEWLWEVRLSSDRSACCKRCHQDSEVGEVLHASADIKRCIHV